jgi:hypothetical protein
MTDVVRSLILGCRARDTSLSSSQLVATLMASVNCQAGSVVLYANPYGNMEVRFPALSKPVGSLYAVPGSTILFSVAGYSYSVTRHVISDLGLSAGKLLLVDERSPRLFDGDNELYSAEAQHIAPTCILAINIPDASKDIKVYCARTLIRHSWLPADPGVQRFLVGLEAMIAVGDPNTGRVAVELMSHPHPEVKWAAFKVLLDRDPSVAARFVPVLRSLNCPVINATLERGGRLVNEFAGVH